MSSIEANLPPFEVGDGENVSKMWSRWISQFLVYLRATALDREDEERKVALLLTLGGTKLFDLVYSLEVDTSKITLEGLIKILNDHYVPKNLTVERHRFLTCVQEKTETLDKYVSRLKSLSINCELGTLEDDLAKDVMICGIRNAKLKERLLEEASLTLTKAIEMSKAFELSNSTTHSQKAVDTKDAALCKISHQGESSNRQYSTAHDQKPVDTKDAPLDKISHQGKSSKSQRSKQYRRYMTHGQKAVDIKDVALAKISHQGESSKRQHSTAHDQKPVDTKDAPLGKISHQGKSSKNQRSTTNDQIAVDTKDSALNKICHLANSSKSQRSKQHGTLENHVSEQIKISESDELFQKFARFILEEYFSTKNADWEAWTSNNEVLSKDMSDEQRMKKFVDFVYEKVIDEHHLSAMYAQLCFALQSMKVQVVKEKVDEATPQSVGFRKVLLLKCQHEFKKTIEGELDIDARKQIAETKDQDKRKELLLAFEEDERKIRIKSVGLVRFIGELFKKNMLTHNIMHQCITDLIKKADDKSLECLCELLATIGKDLEPKSNIGEFNNYFATMTKLSHESPDSKISSRIRFMLQDVIELRANKWISRRDAVIHEIFESLYTSRTISFEDLMKAARKQAENESKYTECCCMRDVTEKLSIVNFL